MLAEDRYVVTVTDSFDETLPPYGAHYTDKQKPSILPLEQLAQHITMTKPHRSRRGKHSKAE